MNQNCERRFRRKRLLWLALFVFILFSFLIIKFYSIQILEGEKWECLAKRQHFIVIKEPFLRGTFYSNPLIFNDHHSQIKPFTIDVPKFHLFADPHSIPTELKSEVSRHISDILKLKDHQQIKVFDQLNKKSRHRKIICGLDQETRNAILRWWSPYARDHKIARNALFFIKDYERSYPFGKMLGQVLHTIQSQKDDVTGKALPTGGLELYFDAFLQGKNGKRRLMRSPRNALETGDVITYPENGADVYLTINPVLQAIAEEEIEKGVKKCRAKCGWVGVMNPKNGEILALAQYPFFNPSDYQYYFNQPHLIEHTKVKAITDANEPGSVFKPITVAIALKANEELRERGEKELFSPEEKISTLSGHFSGRSKPISDTKIHHFLNLNMAMQKSSNIYMARLVERIINRMGTDWYRKQLTFFGFGQKTGVELPAESAGLLPMPGKMHPNGSLEWSASTPFSIAFGHNVQVTTLQLMRAYAVIANNGVLVQPTVVRRIEKKEVTGEITVLLDHTTDERRNTFPKVYNKKIFDRVIEAMRYVTKPGGTATRADVPGYTEVCKTSTPKKIINGRYSEKLYCPSLAGFAPLENPAFVIVVTMDEPEYGYFAGVGKQHNGGNCTGAVFQQVAKRSLEYLEIPSDDIYGYPYGDPRRDPEKEVWMKETKKLKELYEAWNENTRAH